MAPVSAAPLVPPGSDGQPRLLAHPQLAPIYDHVSPCFPPEYRIFGVVRPWVQGHVRSCSTLLLVATCVHNLQQPPANLYLCLVQLQPCRCPTCPLPLGSHPFQVCAEHHRQLSSMIDFIGLCADNLANADILKACVRQQPAACTCPGISQLQSVLPSPAGAMPLFCAPHSPLAAGAPLLLCPTNRPPSASACRRSCNGSTATRRYWPSLGWRSRRCGCCMQLDSMGSPAGQHGLTSWAMCTVLLCRPAGMYAECGRTAQ